MEAREDDLEEEEEDEEFENSEEIKMWVEIVWFKN